MSKGPKVRLEIIEPAAKELIDLFSPFCTQVEIAGTIRRRRPFVSDIEDDRYG